jgi:D-glycero-beta-D-manno-heptose 1-phosphate adenylyltransferase
MALPDVLVKADWADEANVGRDIIEQRGGRVVGVPLEPGRSTSAIIHKISSRSGP